MNLELLDQQLSQLPLYIYAHVDPAGLEFSQRIRWICENECPRYGKSWACPPAVGDVESCKAKCLAHKECLVIGTVTETEDIADMETALATRFDHEAITEEVAQLLRSQGIEPYILSTESCAFCEHCAWCEGKPCRFPEKLYPSMEACGLFVSGVCSDNGVKYYYGDDKIAYTCCILYN